MDDVYAVKKITFLGKPVTTICQSINGPCPLLAICNVLLLRGHLAIDEFVTPDGLISAHDLMRVVQNRLVSANPLVPGSSDLAHLTREKTLQDVISLLPSLLVGLDVNVRFHKITDFEYTVECAVFDMLDIALVHGWLLDTQDANTLRVVQNKSYNELVAQLVEYRSVLMTESSGDSSEALAATADAEATVATSESPPQAADASTVPADSQTECERTLPEPITAEVKAFPSLAIDTNACSSNAASGATDSSLASPTATLSLESPSAAQRKSPSKKTVQVMMRERDISDADAVSTATVLLEDGPVLEEFFDASASQLTYYGLVKLHEEVRERQLCVFFRNNHFSTLFKYNGSLFLLVTDAGYLDEPTVVWERLNEIDGDSEYFDASFRPLNVSETNQQSILTRQEQVQKQRTLEAQSRSESGATQQLLLQGASSDHAGAVSGNHNGNSDDPDYLLALRLQQEEEARVKRASPAISPRRQPSPVSLASPPAPAFTAAATSEDEDEDEDASRDNSSSRDREDSSSASQFEDGIGNSVVDANDVLPITADGELLLTEAELEAQRQAERFYQDRKRQQDEQTYQLQMQQQQQTSQHQTQQYQTQQHQTQQQRVRASTSRGGRQGKSDNSDCCIT